MERCTSYYLNKVGKKHTNHSSRAKRTSLRTVYKTQVFRQHRSAVLDFLLESNRSLFRRNISGSTISQGGHYSHDHWFTMRLTLGENIYEPEQQSEPQHEPVRAAGTRGRDTHLKILFTSSIIQNRRGTAGAMEA